MRNYTEAQIAKLFKNVLYHFDHDRTERSQTDQMNFYDLGVEIADAIEALTQKGTKKLVLRGPNKTPPTIPAGIYTDDVGNCVEIKWAKFDEAQYAAALAIHAAPKE